MNRGLAAGLAVVGALVLLKAIGRSRSGGTTAAKVEALRQAVLDALAEISNDKRWDPSRSCIILSGGVDTSIVAEAGGQLLGLQGAVTVLATQGATDRPHAAAVADAARLRHHVVDLGLEQLLELMPEVVRVRRTFDGMTLRNDLAVAAALREAARLGYTCAVTGDGADELLGGYNFTHGLAEPSWRANRGYMAATMEFGSPSLGEHVSIWVASPFTSRRVVKAALRFGKGECVGPAPAATARDGSGGGNGGSAAAEATPAAAKQGAPRTLGKLPLRAAFPTVTSCWRGKDPIEVGCGATELGSRPWLGAAASPGYFESRIPGDEYERERAAVLQRHGVTIRDKEHLAYYRIFREVFPDGIVPGLPRQGSDPCPACGYQLRRRDQPFCHTCGHYDAQLRDRHVRRRKAA